ncbi:MAG TPA: glycoside hydrolase family 125 protein [Candidatus Limnocylindria bacterium]
MDPGRIRMLDRSRPYKPLDIGNGLVAASVSPSGGIHSILTYDRDHGLVELTAHPPFDDALRYDQAAVRAYRATLAAPDAPAFGLRLAIDGEWRARVRADGAPIGEIETGDVRVTVTTVAPGGMRGIAQQWQVTANRSCTLGCAWQLDPTLRRPSYPQLTEGGPLPAIDALDQRGWHLLAIGPRAPDLRATEMRLEAGTDVTFSTSFLFGSDAGEHRGTATAREGSAVERALGYARICAIRTEPDAFCILADHRILPLSWNRDAYYVATLLRERGDRGLVSAHLRWLFRVAERRDGVWGRSHLANGRVKDPAFQLDQQCYPLLEAAESGAAATYASEIRETLAALERWRHGDLYTTAETPADDPMPLPFHFSSHVLLWRTLRALSDAGFDVDAERVRRATLAAFVDQGRFAYATDGRGRHHHYHDANDLPTVLAPRWGFCMADDPHWRATIAFAWSAENAAWYGGPLGGLGSVHTPHPWPLGDAQELIVATAVGDATRRARVIEKLRRVATWDGLYPEAYDERTGEVRSRHWFAWPAAVIALEGA